MTFREILDATRAESQQRQHAYPLATVQRKAEKMGPTRGFAQALRQKPFSVIGEIKRESPSMGKINPHAVEAAHDIYAEHKVVSAISVLTQSTHFGGMVDDLEKIRKLTERHPKPILRKDFIFSEYEIYYSRSIGADAILLMANVVENKAEFKKFHDLALSIGLDVLCEVHDEAEIALLPDTVRICGINSRRFKGVSQKQLLSTASRDMQTNIATFDLFEKLERSLPSGCLKVAESGISSQNIGEVLRKYHFNAALIGTSLLKCSRPEMVAALDKIQSEADSVFSAAAQSPVKRQASCAV